MKPPQSDSLSSDIGTAAPLAACLGGSVVYANTGSLGSHTAAAISQAAPSYDEHVTVITLPTTDAAVGASEWAPRMVPPPARLLRACELPRLMADEDGCGRIAGIRQFIKHWAVAGDRRMEMIDVVPRAHRRWHRLTRRRFDLARIAAVVHALCERDDVAVPAWVMQHRASTAVCLNDRKMTHSRWDSHIRAIAPDACAFHDVWFAPVDLDDYRVHGFR